MTIDGQMVNSVSGGGHWGGGMHISALDQARFGYLNLHKGRWGDRQILSDEWLTMAETPAHIQRASWTAIAAAIQVRSSGAARKQSAVTQ